MKHGDIQVGSPFILFQGTQAEVEALTVSEGALAYATDLGQVGYYDGEDWIWVDPAGGTDSNAVHDNVDGEIHAVTVKLVPGPDDEALIEDADDSYAKKRVTLNTLPIFGLPVLQGYGAGITTLRYGLYAFDNGVDGAGWYMDYIRDCDPGAMHNNKANEISSATEKTAPVGADIVLIEDSEASYAKKKVQLGNVSYPEYISYVCNGRLTLETGVPVSTADQSGKATLYFTPFRGNKIALYNGASWDILDFSELSISLVGATASKPYDVFCYNNSGTPTLEILVWTNASTRATALVVQDGVLVKSGAETRRYLGTIYVNASGGQTDDTEIKRNVWNYYNRVSRTLLESEASGHTYNGGARKWNNSDTDNKLEYILGYAEDSIGISYRGALIAGADGSYAVITIYLDGSEINTAYRVGNFNASQVVGGVSFSRTPSVGYHYAQVYELGNHAGSYFANMMFTIGLQT